LFGNLLGYLACVLNFFVMGLCVQSAVTKEEKQAKRVLQLSQSARMFGLFVVALVGHLVPIFNLICVVIPFLFPRIAVSLRPIFKKEG
jgi:hypothetical protein